LEGFICSVFLDLSSSHVIVFEAVDCHRARSYQNLSNRTSTIRTDFYNCSCEHLNPAIIYAMRNPNDIQNVVVFGGTGAQGRSVVKRKYSMPNGINL
jgi:hypothetical protein